MIFLKFFALDIACYSHYYFELSSGTIKNWCELRNIYKHVRICTVWFLKNIPFLSECTLPLKYGMSDFLFILNYKSFWWWLSIFILIFYQFVKAHFHKTNKSVLCINHQGCSLPKLFFSFISKSVMSFLYDHFLKSFELALARNIFGLIALTQFIYSMHIYSVCFSPKFQ